MRYAINDLINEREEEKVERLKNARVEFVTASKDSIAKMSEIDVRNASSQQVEKLIFPLLDSFDTFGKHYNNLYNIEFDYSRRSASRSISHQIRMLGKDFSANAIVHANLKELCKTAYPVEVHEDEKPNIKAFETQRIKEIITLFNALQVGKDAIFVKMTVKVPHSLSNRLHMVVTSEIKKGLDLVLLAEAYAGSGAVHSADKSSPTISIQSFLEKVKDIDEFVKRIPIEKILESNDNSKKSKDDTIDEDYLAAVERGDMETTQRMVDEAAKAAGYNTSKLYHITKSQQFIRWFGDWQNKPDILLQQNLKTDFWRRTESLLLGEGGAPPKMKSKKKCLSVRA